MVWRTFDSRGKSATPESRMEMEDWSVVVEAWREDTQPVREADMVGKRVRLCDC